MTLVTTITANERMMKNLLIFQGNSVPVDIDVWENILLHASPSGWIDSDSKRHWFDHFLKYVKSIRKTENEVHLLLLDGHNSNWDNEMLELARKEHIEILQFPAHTTHITTSRLSFLPSIET